MEEEEEGRRLLPSNALLLLPYLLLPSPFCPPPVPLLSPISPTVSSFLTVPQTGTGI